MHEERPSPISAVAQPQAAKAAVAAPTPSVTIVQHLWITWFKIAKLHTDMATEARAACLAAAAEDLNHARSLSLEFEASLIAVNACGNCLDALYGSLAVSETARMSVRQRLSQARRQASRHAHIREALKLSFAVTEKNAEWKREFTWLYRLRNFAAHAKDETHSPILHPIGVSTSPVMLDYSMESAQRALRLVTDVFDFCSKNPRTNLPESIRWANEFKHVVISVYGDYPQ